MLSFGIDFDLARSAINRPILGSEKLSFLLFKLLAYGLPLSLLTVFVFANNLIRGRAQLGEVFRFVFIILVIVLVWGYFQLRRGILDKARKNSNNK